MSVSLGQSALASKEDWSQYFEDGQRAEKAQKYGSAIHDYGRAIEANSKNAELYARRAKCEIECGKLHDAISDLDAALRLEPASRKVLIAKHKLLAVLKDWQTARDVANTALTAFPNDAELYTMRAYDSYKLEQWSDVVADASTAIQLLGTTSTVKQQQEAYNLRVLGYIKLGQMDKAEADQKISKQLASNAP